MVSKRKPEQKSFDVDAFLRSRHERFAASGMTDSELDEIFRKAAAEPGREAAWAAADRMYDAWRKEATDPNAVHRPSRTQRKRPA